MRAEGIGRSNPQKRPPGSWTRLLKARAKTLCQALRTVAILLCSAVKEPARSTPCQYWYICGPRKRRNPPVTHYTQQSAIHHQGAESNRTQPLPTLHLNTGFRGRRGGACPSRHLPAIQAFVRGAGSRTPLTWQDKMRSRWPFRRPRKEFLPRARQAVATRKENRASRMVEAGQKTHSCRWR